MKNIRSLFPVINSSSLQHAREGGDVVVEHQRITTGGTGCVLEQDTLTPQSTG